MAATSTGEFFNVQTDTLDMHIRWRELAAVFAIEKPGHMDGMATRSIQLEPLETMHDILYDDAVQPDK